MALTAVAEKLALCVARGQKIVDAAPALGLTTVQAYRVIQRSNGAFRAFVEQVREQVRQASVSSLVERIVQEGLPSVETLVKLRDNDGGTDSEGLKIAVDPSTRRGCANDLLDRNPATARIARSEQKAETTIHFGADVVAYLDRVIAERPGQQIIDVEAIETVPALMPAFDVRPIEDIVDAYEAAS
jgi:hypothetical protein